MYHSRRIRLVTPQTSCTVDSLNRWQAVPLCHCNLHCILNYFLHEIQRKDHTQWQILFEMRNKLTINFFHRDYTNFDRDKYRDTWYIINRTLINLSQAKSYRHLITLKQHRVSPGFCSFSPEGLYESSNCFIAVSEQRLDSSSTNIDFPNMANKNIFKM